MYRIQELGKLKKFSLHTIAQDALNSEAAAAAAEGPGNAKRKKNPLLMTGQPNWTMCEARVSTSIIDDVIQELVKEALRDILSQGASNQVLAAAYDLKWRRPVLQRGLDVGVGAEKIMRPSHKLSAAFEPLFGCSNGRSRKSLAIHQEIANARLGESSNV